MNKSEFTNVKKLQDPFPHLCCFREERRPRTKKSLSWNGKLCLHLLPSLKADPGNNRLNLGFILIANISSTPQSQKKNFNGPTSNDTSPASQKEAKKLREKADKS